MDIAADDRGPGALVPPPPLAPADDPMLRSLTVAALNHLLTHELMSAEACRSASVWFEHLPVAGVLRSVMEGHHLRAGALYEHIRNQDGHPAVDPHRQDLSVTPAISDAQVVLALLLDLEQRGVAAYRQSLGQLDTMIRTVVEAELLPAQETALATIAAAQPPSPDGAV